MTWTLASFTILFLALTAGFGWYERAAPSTKVLALVATLAALAAIGRIAFAPLPNVKPTTDIVLLSGYVLGGAPGFAVGAVAALASNLFFGQGPWTPFQMGAWGLCGMFGAGLALMTGRRMGRWPLALCCGLAGLGFGVIMDLQTWISLSGSHTLAQFVVISGVSLSYNLAHAFGNIAFCLAFGPAFVRALERFRTRMQIRWVPLSPGPLAGVARGVPTGGPLALVVAGIATLALAAGAGPGPLGTDTAQAASAKSRTLGYLQRSRNADGGWGAARGRPSSSLFTAWSAIGTGAAGKRCPSRTVTLLRRQAVGQNNAADLERSILALRACGQRARDSRGRVLLRVLRERQRSDGSVTGLTNQTAFFLLALRAGGAGKRDGAVRRAGSFIARQQNNDGGWSFQRKGNGSGVDDTAAALQAMVAAGRGGRPVSRAVTYLRAHQNRDGGFAVSRGASNAQSTAFAVQGLVAARVNVERVRKRGSRSPLGYLGSLIQRDGSVRYSRTVVQTPTWVTAQALTAFSRRAFPIVR